MQDLVTVFGGSGFVGRAVVRELAKAGLRIRVAARHAERGYRLRPLGDVGQIEIVQANVRNENSVVQALEGASAAVNLVAVLVSRGAQNFQALHVDAAALIARQAAVQGLDRLVHVSAIGADPSSPGAYGRTKAAGEAAVLAAFPTASLVRPSIIFGPDDAFFNRFASMASVSPVLPVIKAATRFQPVYVGDVGKAVSALASGAAKPGVFELGGPRLYSFADLMELICRETGLNPLRLSLPDPIAGLLAATGDLISPLIAPPITSDQLAMLSSDNVVAADAIGLADLGIDPVAVEAIIPTYLGRYRHGGQYAATPKGAIG